MFDFLTKLRKKTALPYSSRYFPSGGIIPPEYTTSDLLAAYSQVGWWHAVVFRIALGLSEVQWNLFDVANRDKPKQVFDHPLLNLLHLCNPYQTSEELIALDTIYMESLGESFWVLNYNGKGEPAEVVLAYPDLMSVIPAKEFPFVKGYVYGIGQNAVPLDPKEVIHFKYPNPTNQFRGLGQAAAIGVNLSAEKNADKWVDQFFYNSARPDGVIQFDYSLSDEQFDKLKKRWTEKYRGVNKAHQVALLEGGGKYVQVQNSVKDMDFPNLKQKNRDIILGIEGMPLSIMGISENVNKANAEAGDYTFARWVLKPRLDWKKAKLQEQLLPKFKNSQNLKLGYEEIVPETAEQKRLDAESGMRAGYLTVNEARIATGKDPLPPNVGDVLLLPLNLIPTPINKPIQPPAPESTSDEMAEDETHETEQPKSKGLTPDQKRIHWESYAKKTEQQESVIRRVFNDVFAKQGKKTSDYYAEHGKLPKLNNSDTAKHFEPAIELIYHDSFEDAVPGKSVKQLDDFARQWILARSLTLAKAINLTTLEALRREITIGFEAGESIRQIAARIEGYFTDNAEYRANMVSRTEVIAASNEGALHRFESEGIDKSEFFIAPDACEECIPYDGKVYATKDSHGIIPIHPNCRCVWLPSTE